MSHYGKKKQSCRNSPNGLERISPIHMRSLAVILEPETLASSASPLKTRITA